MEQVCSAKTLKGKTILLFGGSGFIGSHLSQLLLDLGCKVISADLVPSRLSGIEFIECDIRGMISQVDIKPDIVINAAAIHREPGHAPNEYYETNVLGSKNVAEWCKSREVETVMFISSISVYGASEDIKDEDSYPNPTSNYGLSKLLGEAFYRESITQSSNIYIIRPSAIFGNGENGHFTKMAKAMRRSIFFTSKQDNPVKACGYVKDLANAIVFILEGDKKNRIFNFSFEHNPTLTSITNEFEYHGDFTKVRQLPGFIFNGTRTLLKYLHHNSYLRLNKLSTSTNVMPKNLKEAGFYWEYDLSSAIKDWKRESNFQ